MNEGETTIVLLAGTVVKVCGIPVQLLDNIYVSTNKENVRLIPQVSMPRSIMGI